MSVFRKIANATASNKPESTRESLAIEEELDVRSFVTKFCGEPVFFLFSLDGLFKRVFSTQKIEEVDKFVHGFFDNVQKKIVSAQGTWTSNRCAETFWPVYLTLAVVTPVADVDAELALWNALKEQGSEWKKDDFTWVRVRKQTSTLLAQIFVT